MRVSDALTAGQLPAVLPWLAPCLDAVTQRGGEDVQLVLDALAQPTATFHWLFERDAEPEGFVILTAQDAEELFVWVAVAARGHCSAPVAVSDALAAFARAHGFSRLRFDTTRPGWARGARKLGYQRQVDGSYLRSLA